MHWLTRLWKQVLCPHTDTFWTETEDFNITTCKDCGHQVVKGENPMKQRKRDKIKTRVKYGFSKTLEFSLPMLVGSVIAVLILRYCFGAY